MKWKLGLYAPFIGRTTILVLASLNRYRLPQADLNTILPKCLGLFSDSERLKSKAAKQYCKLV